MKPGFPAPDFDAKDLDGKPIRLGDFRGQFVLLYAWSDPQTRSPQLFPQIAANVRLIQNELSDSRLALLGIAISSAAEQVRIIADREKLSHRHVFHPGNPLQNPVASAYRVQGDGEGFLINPEGKLVAVISMSATGSLLSKPLSI